MQGSVEPSEKCSRVPTLGLGLSIGHVQAPNSVVLAPMSGVSDLPFRRIADRFGVGLVVSEMPSVPWMAPRMV